MDADPLTLPETLALEVTTLGDTGASLFAAAVFLLRRDVVPVTARSPLATASAHVCISAHQLRTKAALFLQNVVAPAFPDTWDIAERQIGSYGWEDGPPLHPSVTTCALCTGRRGGPMGCMSKPSRTSPAGPWSSIRLPLRRMAPARHCGGLPSHQSGHTTRDSPRSAGLVARPYASGCDSTGCGRSRPHGVPTAATYTVPWTSPTL